MTSEKIAECLNKLKVDSKPKWGTMSPQHMIEHLEYTYRIASGEIQDFEVATPERYLEKTHETLYNYKSMPKEYDFPLAEKSKISEFIHPNLEVAKKMMLEARDEYLARFKDDSELRTKNAVFGELNRFEWYLMERKHLNHHFKQFGLL